VTVFFKRNLTIKSQAWSRSYRIWKQSWCLNFNSRIQKGNVFRVSVI